MNLRFRFALISLVFVGMLAIFFSLVEDQADEIKLNRRQIEEEWFEVESLFDLYAEFSRIYELHEELPAPSDEAAWKTWENSYTQETLRVKGQLVSLEARAADDSDDLPGELKEHEAIEQLKESLIFWQDLGRKAVADRELALADRESIHARYAVDLEALNHFFLGARMELRDALERLDETEDQLNSALINVTFGAILMLMIAWIGFGVWMIRPLGKLQRLVREARAGNFALGVPQPQSRHEVGELTRTFLEMAREVAGFTDRLEQRVAERTRELEESRRRLQTLLDRLPDAVGLVDGDGQLITGNDAYHALLDGDMASPFTTLSSFQQLPQGYIRWPAREGHRLLAVDRFSLDAPEQAAEGADHVVLEYIRDVTRQHEVEAALAASQRLAAIGRLSAGIAHEINNPLTSIAACSEGLLKRLGDNGDVDAATFRDYLGTIRGEVFRCKEITEKLLDVTRQREERFEDFDARDVVIDMARLAEAMAAKRGLRLRAVTPESAKLYSNPRALRQVILNLLMNAIEAGGEGGKILLQADCDDEMLEVIVEDDGCGIDAVALQRLFEPFYTRRADSRGTGLGLFVCQGLVQAMGGDISAFSEGPGSGARFTVRLPRRLSARPASPPAGLGAAATTTETSHA